MYGIREIHVGDDRERKRRIREIYRIKLQN